MVSGTTVNPDTVPEKSVQVRKSAALWKLEEVNKAVLVNAKHTFPDDPDEEMN